MLGFFVQLGVIVPLYNASLNAFFLLTIVYGITEARIKKWAEPTMHAVPILYPLVTASIGVGISLYSENELGLTCWIGEYPRGCDVNPEVECVSKYTYWMDLRRYSSFGDSGVSHNIERSDLSEG